MLGLISQFSGVARCLATGLVVATANSVVDGGTPEHHSPIRLIASNSAPAKSPPAARWPTIIRHLTPSEIEKAKTVFGESLDFDHIAVTDGLGTDGRAFVIINPFQLAAHWLTGIPVPRWATIQIVNWGPKPSSGIFFHELTHVWQSQHHRNPEAFMINASVSQFAATILNKHAYAFIPGRPFESYGAEQMAQQVQRTKSPIIKHIRNVPRNAVDPLNIPFPWLPKFESLDGEGVEL
jgi:hypothetical protein